MDPTLGEQKNQTQEKQPRENPNPIDALNNFMNIRRSLGRKATTQVGKTAAQAAGKMAVQTATKTALTNPYVLAALGIIVLIVIVFVIVVSGVAPGAPSTTGSGSVVQTEVSPTMPLPEP